MRGITWADPEGVGGGRGSGPRKITSYMGFYREQAIGPPPIRKKLDPRKMVHPHWNFENDSFL